MDEQDSGPGNAAHFIRVRLQGTGKVVLNGGPQDVLVLEPDPTDPAVNPRNYVTLHWQSPTRLLLAYRDSTPNLVVSRIAGVNIVTEPS